MKIQKASGRRAFQIVVLAMKTTIGKSGKSQGVDFSKPNVERLFDRFLKERGLLRKARNHEVAQCGGPPSMLIPSAENFCSADNFVSRVPIVIIVKKQASLYFQKRFPSKFQHQ
jgi:hypothetical protein